MPTVAFLEVVAPEDGEQILRSFPDALQSAKNLQEENLLEQCKDAEVLSVFIYSTVGERELKALPRLKLLCTRSVGYDHIDLAACQKRGVMVCNVPDYGAHVIAEHVFALLLSALRHIPEGDDRVESGAFDYRGLRGKTLRGKTLGIVGTGKIGCRVAQIANGFGMKIIAVDRCRNIELEELLHVQYVLLEEALARSDILSLHVPATEETQHMINAKTIQQMKNGVVIINTARGTLIDSSALLDALESGKVSYALLDVLEHEKETGKDAALIAHPNAITTPHIAFYADDSMRNMYDDCFESIEQWRDGKTPEHVVRPPQLVCDLPGIQCK
ncbi:phosphoglycerate dehydrogenase [Candidatus Peregrinibacteria bacterium CG10_big_fil_rev_8_21_14_0_10_55_24]|nr:MAG: phosphoglycerate dehydrogenase [Candidatus Peregrinibacteria bacterium CG10_big_fil_rev_8_21_14_0_10_55_24]